MVEFVNSLKRLITVLVLLVLITFGAMYGFNQLIAIPIGLSGLILQTVRTVIVVFFGLTIVLFIRPSKSLISKSVGAHPATVFQFFMVLTTIIVIFFVILNILQVEATTPLLGGGIASIIVGLVISTFVGNILAGMLVLVTNPFKEGRHGCGQ